MQAKKKLTALLLVFLYIQEKAEGTCTNPEKGATVRTVKNQGWFWIILKISLSGGKQL